VGEITIRIPAGVDSKLLKRILERDAQLLAKALKKKVYPGMLGEATVEELERYAEEAGL